MEKIFIFGEQVLYSLITFIVSILMAKYLAADEFGLWVLFTTLFYFLITMSSASLWQLYIVRYNKINGYISKIFYTNSIFLLSVILAVILTFLIVLGLYYYYKLSIFLAITLYFFSVFSIVYEAKRRICIAAGRGKKMFIMTFTRMSFLVFSLLFLTQSKDIHLELVVAYFTISLFFLLPYRIKNIFRFSLWPRMIRAHHKLLKVSCITDWKDNKLLLSKSMLHYFTSQLYILIIGFYLGLEDLAFFEIVRLVFSPIMILVVGLNSVSILYFVSVYKRDKSSLIKKIRKITLLWSVVVIIYISLIYSNIETIDQYVFNGKYYSEDMLSALKFFSIAVLSSSILPFISNYFVITDTNKYALRTSAIVFVINLIFSPVIINSFGLMGAFIGTSFVQFLLLSINVYYVYKVSKYKLL